ncbi:MAG: PilW family protein [Moraxellaceae bacterium]
MSRMRFFQAGLSLIELMISLALGLVLVAGATQIFFTNTQAFRLQNNISGAQEAGRLGLEMLLTDLRRAGVDNPESVLDGASRNFGITGRNALATTAAVTGLLTNSDEVSVSYRVPPEVAQMSDCEGHVANSTDVIVNRYFVALDINPSVPALFCIGKVNGLPANSPGAALIRGVESFQVQYGLAAGYGKTAAKGNGFTSAVRYVLGGNGTLQSVDGVAGVNAEDALLVTSVKIAMVVRSESGIQGLRAPANDIAVLDTTISTATLDGVKVNNFYPVHRFFTGTAVMRNNVYGYF